MRCRLLILGVAALLSLNTTLSAQAPASLAAGTRVRVTSISYFMVRRHGTIAGTAGDTLLFQPARCDTSCPVVRLAPDALDRLEVFNGRSPVRGAVVGGLIGGAAGALIGVLASTPDSCGDGQRGLDAAGKCAGEALAVPVIAGGIGTLAGALIGAAIGVGERWRDVQTVSPEFRLSLAPTHRGVALTLRAAF